MEANFSLSEELRKSKQKLADSTADIELRCRLNLETLISSSMHAAERAFDIVDAFAKNQEYSKASNGRCNLIKSSKEFWMMLSKQGRR